MTTVKAQAVTAALVGAGFVFTITKLATDNWVIRVRSGALDIPVTVANQFGIDQAITGKLQEIEYS